jgi:hypothetical protein
MEKLMEIPCAEETGVLDCLSQLASEYDVEDCAGLFQGFLQDSSTL